MQFSRGPSAVASMRKQGLQLTGGRLDTYSTRPNRAWVDLGRVHSARCSLICCHLLPGPLRSCGYREHT